MYKTLTFLFFFKGRSQPTKEEKCREMMLHQRGDAGSDLGVWDLSPCCCQADLLLTHISSP